MFIPSSSCFHGFWREECYNSYPYSSIGKMFPLPPSGFFQDFDFGYTEYDIPNVDLCVCVCVYFSCIVFPELPGSVVLCPSWIVENFQSLLLQIFFVHFFVLFYFWYSHCICYTFSTVPQFLDIVLKILFLFAFEFVKFLLTIFKLVDSFLEHVNC